MAVTKTKEQPESDEKGKFRNKYIIFCTYERKNMCELLGSADKTCTLLKVHINILVNLKGDPPQSYIFQ